LDAVNELPGLSITFVIRNSVQSLFTEKGRLDCSSLDFESLQNLSSPLAEKFLRVTHLLSLIVAALSGPGQDLLWVTDEDAIAANETRVRQLVDTFARVSSHCLHHDLRHLRVATGKQDNGDLSLEDLLSIPDIVAGALSAAIEEMFGKHGTPPSGMFLPPPEHISDKTRRVMDWFADTTQPLRRVTVMIDEVADTHHLRATHLQFHGLRDLFRAS
jgi:hypothetical protein